MKASRLIWFSMLCVIFLLAVSFAAAQEATPNATPQEQAHRDLLDRAGEALATGNFDLLTELVSEAYVVHSPVGDLDRDGFIAFMQALRASLSDFSLTRDAVIVEGEDAATRTLITGTFDGADFASPMGVLPANGQPITVVVQTFHHFDVEGRIVEEWAMFDLLSFFTQLGAFPAQSN
jgi:steroid delta-isomerase-like uncharacterized protein